MRLLLYIKAWHQALPGAGRPAKHGLRNGRLLTIVLPIIYSRSTLKCVLHILVQAAFYRTGIICKGN